MLNSTACSFPTQSDDGDGSLVSFIGTTGLDGTGIEVRVYRWVEPNEPARVRMTLDLPAKDKLEAMIEFDDAEARGMQEALRDNDRGLHWMVDHATYGVLPYQAGWMAQIAADAWHVNPRMCDLVDDALVAMSELGRVTA